MVIYDNNMAYPLNLIYINFFKVAHARWRMAAKVNGSCYEPMRFHTWTWKLALGTIRNVDYTRRDYNARKNIWPN